MKKALYLTHTEIRDLIVEALKARDFQVTGAVGVEFVTEQNGAVGALVGNMQEPTTEVDPPGEETPIAKLSLSRLREVTDQVLVREGAEGDAGEIAEFALQILLDHKEVEACDGSRAFNLALVELTPRVDCALRDLEEEGRAELVNDDDEDPEDPYWRTKRRPKRPPKKKKKEEGSPARVRRDTCDVISREPILKGVLCVWFPGLGVTVTHPDEWPEDLRKEYDPSPSLFEGVEKPEPSASAAADILGGDGGVMGRGDGLGEGVEDERPAETSRKKTSRRRPF